MSTYPPRPLQNEIKNLLLKVGIAPTRSLMDKVKKLTEEQAESARDTLARVARVAQRARRQHPEGKRATDKQLLDWERWMTATGSEVTPEALAHFLNLDTKSANADIMALRFLFWEERDAKGKTPLWRVKRNLTTESYEPGKRRLTLSEL